MTPAQRGATLLDEKCQDWYNRIDCANLDITSTRLCILGQLYGHYIYGGTALGFGSLHNEFTVVMAALSDHGFAVPFGGVEDFFGGSLEAIEDFFGGSLEAIRDKYARLNEQWREEIAVRRLADHAQANVQSEVVASVTA